MVLNKALKKLSNQDVTSLCDAAIAAWDNTSNSSTKVVFTWKNKHYQSKLTSFRMLVETATGIPVAARYI